MTKGILTHLSAIAFGAVATFGLLQLGGKEKVSRTGQETYAHIYEVSKVLAELVALNPNDSNAMELVLSSGQAVKVELNRLEAAPAQATRQDLAYFSVIVDGEGGIIDSNGTMVIGNVLVGLVDAELYHDHLASK
ncbi:hypothetical protein WG68_11670 [Arsukibacterium ikkense]|uniref:Uncharacterized protein n=1 Tax=Arsukibacterium ikkense TaxID=336831 RepID=A0A0M2V612_9GAMM|nr:hypothetical protein [Arsukibacterium ikkense]KKO45090.1 hypothetical protein WG68_11670 [Arsukibacterium ikkense]